jgi:drug/metabolite transporter (DMT)-like permease
MTLLGDLLAIAGSIALSAYLLAIRTVSDSYPTRLIVSRTYAWAAVGLLIVACIAGQPPPKADDLVSWGGITCMALISQMLGHTGINASLKHFSASTVAFSTLLEPVFAAALAALLFAEQLSFQALCGCLIVLACLIVVLRER